MIYVGLGLAAGFGGLWLYFIVERKGWSWLWIGWGSGLLLAGPGRDQRPRTPAEPVRQVPDLQRLDDDHRAAVRDGQGARVGSGRVLSISSCRMTR